MSELQEGTFDLESGGVSWHKVEPILEGKRNFVTQSTSLFATYLAEEKEMQVDYVWLKRERRRPAITVGKHILQVNTTTYRPDFHGAQSVMLCPNADKAKRKGYHEMVGRKLIYNDVTDFVILLLDDDQKEILLRYPEITPSERKQLLGIEMFIMSREEVVGFFKQRTKSKGIHQRVWRNDQHGVDAWLKGFKKKKKQEGF